MSEFAQGWIDFENAQPFIAAGVGWGLHAAVIVAVAWMMTAANRRGSSDFRHAVWISAFASLSLLAIFPRTSLPLNVPVDITRVSLRTETSTTTSGMIQEPVEVFVVDTIDAAESRLSYRQRDVSKNDVSEMKQAGHGRNASVSFQSDMKSADVDRTEILSSIGGARIPTAGQMVIGIYAFGVAAWISRILSSLVRLRRYAKNAAPLGNAPSDLARHCAGLLGLKAMPACRVSKMVSAPLTFGTFRPIILVPSSFLSLSNDQQRHCFLHEMAHVQHRDAWWNWLSELTTALYWFHPLVHLARKRLRLAREDAADDSVVRAGEAVIGYSKTLVEIARLRSVAARTPHFAVSSTTDLEQRIRRVLEPGLNVHRKSRYGFAVAGSGLLLLTLTGLTFRTVAAQAPLSTPATQLKPATDNIDSEASGEESAESTSEVGTLFSRFQNVSLYVNPEGGEPEVVDIEFAGRVSDESGPVAGAVVLIREFVQFRGANRFYVSPPIVARTTTNQDGQYKVHKVPLARSKLATKTRWEILVADERGRLGFAAYSPDSFETRRAFRVNPAHRIKANVDVKLQETQVISGTIVNPDESGLAGVRVAVKEVTVPEMLSPDQGPFNDRPAIGPPTQAHTFRFPSDRIHLLAATSVDGTFDLRLPQKCSAVLGLKREGYFPRLVRVSSNGYEKGFGETRMAAEFQSPATIEFRRLLNVQVSVVTPAGQLTSPFQIWVTTPQKQVQSQRLRIIEGNRMQTTAEFLREASDTQGRVELLVKFPVDLGLLPITKYVPVGPLIADQKLVLNAQPGRHVSGRVVKRDDQMAIRNVMVSWHSQKGKIEQTSLQSNTDIQGKWEMVVPREAGYLSVTGESAGLDLRTTDRFNSDSSGLERFTHPLDAGDANKVSIPDFQIDRINDRWVKVVDESGKPVEGVSISAEWIETLVSEGRTYRLERTLAERVLSDFNGEAALTLNCSGWEYGTVKAHVFIQDDEKSTETYLTGRAEITPDSTSPIRLVVLRPWKVNGRVLIDGKPAEDIEVGLVTRAPWQTRRERLSAGYHKIGVDGHFEFDCEPGRVYSVVLLRRTEKVSKYYYVAGKPITAVPPNQFDAGTIEISSEQFRTHQEMYDERQKALGSTPKAP